MVFFEFFMKSNTNILLKIILAVMLSILTIMTPWWGISIKNLKFKIINYFKKKYNEIYR